MTPAQHARLALLLEVAGTPKPGNVDRERDLPDLRFEHFLAGAVGAGPGLDAAAADAPVGEAFERAVAGMSEQSGGNTQFGALLVLVPLVAASGSEETVSRRRVRAVVESTTTEDAAAFFRAFEHVDVTVGPPPPDAEALDVRRGADAVRAVRERDHSLQDVLAMGEDADDVAREWTTGFERSFRAAGLVADATGPLLDRVAAAFLELLASRPDTHVATVHGDAVAASVRERAAALRDAAPHAVRAFAEDLVERGVNPGTTADLVAAGTYVALRRGVVP